MTKKSVNSSSEAPRIKNTAKTLKLLLLMQAKKSGVSMNKSFLAGFCQGIYSSIAAYKFCDTAYEFNMINIHNEKAANYLLKTYATNNRKSKKSN